MRTPYRCEFYPSASSQRSANYYELGVKYGDTDAIYPDYPNFHTFQEWFLKWINNRIIVPDTCIIQNHYLTEILLPRIQNPLKIMIPRFVILELESSGNRVESEKFGKKSGKISIKPRIFSAFNEMRKLQLLYNATNFPSPIKGDFIANFSKISGDEGGDRFIRLEMWDQVYGRRGGMPKEEEKMVLLTKDMMMASAASAEGTDTFYLCASHPEETKFEFRNRSTLLTELAITFSEIRMEGFFDEYNVIIEGMWSGKDIMDWGENRLRIHLEEID